jgi:hypothetical protein
VREHREVGLEKIDQDPFVPTGKELSFQLVSFTEKNESSMKRRCDI